MADLVSVATVVWPALLSISFLLTYLLYVSQLAESPRASWSGAVVSMLILVSIYTVPSVRTLTRLGLSIIGFALPLALGVISIRYIVEET